MKPNSKRHFFLARRVRVSPYPHSRHPMPRMKFVSPVVATIITTTVFASSAWADHADLRTGGGVTGKVVARGKSVLVQTPAGIQLALPADKVRRIASEAQLKKYAEVRDQTGVDPDANVELAKSIMSSDAFPADPKAFRKFHLWRAVAANSDHKASRNALGFRRDEGRWVTSHELMTSRGMVSRNAGWELPEIKARREAAEADEVVAKKYRATLARHFKTIASGSRRAPEALQSIKDQNDPRTSLAFADQFARYNQNDPRSDRARRLLCLEKLAEFKNGIATASLVKAALEDPDAIIREKAITVLKSYPLGRTSAVATYMPMLKAKKASVINRAAAALSHFADPEMDLTYVDALVTTETKVVAPASGGSYSQGSMAGGPQSSGFSTGEKPQIVQQVKRNDAVLALLRTIEPEVNYGFDEQRWREHFAAKRTAYQGDLRRD